jgi:hypothetical protein
MEVWFSVYRHNRWFCFFSFLAIDLLFLLPFVIFYAHALSAGDPIIISFSSSSDLLFLFLIGSFFLLASYYPISLIYNRCFDGLSHDGVICSSTYHFFSGMTLYVSEKTQDESEAMATPSCNFPWCSNAIGSRVRYHFSRSGKVIIDEILD